MGTSIHPASLPSRPALFVCATTSFVEVDVLKINMHQAIYFK